jgi:hypothetical protein
VLLVMGCYKHQHELEGPLQDILKEYEDVFLEPKGLRPIRFHDHSIPIIEVA